MTLHAQAVAFVKQLHALRWVQCARRSDEKCGVRQFLGQIRIYHLLGQFAQARTAFALFRTKMNLQALADGASCRVTQQLAVAISNADHQTQADALAQSLVGAHFKHGKLRIDTTE